MKDIMQRLAELEATAPKVTKKRMLKEDSTTPPMKVSNKPASLKDVFENMAMQKPIPVVGKQGDTQSTGAGFLNINDTSPAGQAMQKALTDLAAQGKAQIVVPTQPGQQPQATAAGQPNPNQLQSGQQAMQEDDLDERDEGKPGKNFAKIAKSAGKRYGSKEAGERVAGAVRAKLMKQGKLEEENLDELSPQTLGSYTKKASNDLVDRSADHAYMSEPGRSPQLHGKAMARNQAKGLNRQQGISRAVDKLSGNAKVPANEGAKVDRMVKHIEKSEKKLGKSKGEAEDIAWATANKRGMLDNKNKKKVKEGDLPSSAGVDTKGAGLGAGRSPTTLEGKTMNKKAKPDFLDIDKDGNKKEPMKKAAADKKKAPVKEGMNGRIAAARHEGRADGLRGAANRIKHYDDLDEARAYHAGYKDGLDECYGQGVYEAAPAMPAATVPGMASAAMPAMEAEFDEGNAFTAALAKTPKGGKFAVGGKTFTDRSNYGENVSEYAFESWDNQLNDLLKEGLSVSVSKGNSDSEDSVNINATGPESEQLMAIVKSAGLGLFGDDNADTHSSAMSVQPDHGAPDEIGAGAAEIGVVDGHDGMMGLMQKLSGIQSGGAGDYADEEGDEEQLYGNHEEAGKKDCGCDGDCECSDYDQPANEQACNECGMMEAQCGCSSNKKMVDEVESEDQMEFEVAEANAPDSGEAESTADEDAEAKEDAALAGADSGDEEEMNESDDKEEDETVSESFANLFRKLAFIAEESTEKEDDKAEKAGEKVTKDIEHDDKEDKKGMSDKQAKFFGKKADKEKVDEWANQVGSGPGKGTDASFQQDIDFMTKVIAGGLNKPKSTGQTTIPVIAGQDDRMIDSPKDWATLAGIKK
jgi:hypothetical protein